MRAGELGKVRHGKTSIYSFSLEGYFYKTKEGFLEDILCEVPEEGLVLFLETTGSMTRAIYRDTVGWFWGGVEPLTENEREQLCL